MISAPREVQEKQRKELKLEKLEARSMQKSLGNGNSYYLQLYLEERKSTKQSPY